MKNYFAAIALFSAALFSSCASSDKDQVEFSGTIQQPEMTTYQYGTHTIEKGSTYYALKSSTLDLSVYNGKEVTITGKKVEGYPVEGGPELIEVSKVQN